MSVLIKPRYDVDITISEAVFNAGPNGFGIDLVQGLTTLSEDFILDENSNLGLRIDPENNFLLQLVGVNRVHGDVPLVRNSNGSYNALDGSGTRYDYDIRDNAPLNRNVKTAIGSIVTNYEKSY